MASLNNCQFIGRLGKDPEVRHLDNGATVANFAIAVSESYKDKTTGDKKETTEWINVVAWKGLAEITERYLHKGDQIFISGKMKTRSWEKDGITRYSTEIHAEQLQMLSNKQQSLATPQTAAPVESSGHSTDDLPF